MFRLEPRPAASPPWSYGSPPLGRGQGRCRMFRLEPRPAASRLWSYGSPLLALALTVLIGTALFIALGKDPVRGLQLFFWEPLKSRYALGELMVKATPLLLIALGLALCFRANVWNIGAEGQYVIGAVAAGGVALLANQRTGAWIWPAILLAGVLGGLGGAGGPVARPVPCERNPGQPDAGLRGRAGAGLSGLWPLERPAGLQLSA